jgi:hypothetical protein
MLILYQFLSYSVLCITEVPKRSVKLVKPVRSVAVAVAPEAFEFTGGLLWTVVRIRNKYNVNTTHPQ